MPGMIPREARGPGARREGGLTGPLRAQPGAGASPGEADGRGRAGGPGTVGTVRVVSQPPELPHNRMQRHMP